MYILLEELELKIKLILDQKKKLTEENKKMETEMLLFKNKLKEQEEIINKLNKNQEEAEQTIFASSLIKEIIENIDNEENYSNNFLKKNTEQENSKTNDFFISEYSSLKRTE